MWKAAIPEQCLLLVWLGLSRSEWVRLTGKVSWEPVSKVSPSFKAQQNSLYFCYRCLLFCFVCWMWIRKWIHPLWSWYVWAGTEHCCLWEYLEAEELLGFLGGGNLGRGGELCSSMVSSGHVPCWCVCKMQKGRKMAQCCCALLGDFSFQENKNTILSFPYTVREGDVLLQWKVSVLWKNILVCETFC